MRESQKVHSGKVRPRSGKRSRKPQRDAERSVFRPGVELLEQRLLLSLSYSTYLGGSKNDAAYDIATDSAGNTYVIGTTKSANLPGFVSVDTGNNRAFVAKFAPDGTIDTAFTRVLGPQPRFDSFGYAESFGYQVVVGPDDRPLVSYSTVETDTYNGGSLGPLPLHGPHFLHIVKLDASGDPMFDTIATILDTPEYLDPVGFFGVNMATDDAGAAYVTYSAIRQIGGGGLVPDSFYTKVAADGSVAFTGHLTGSASAIAVDSLHNIYIAQTTPLADRPVTTGAYQETKMPVVPAGVQNLTTDVWLGVLNPTATSLISATYLGGPFNDSVSAMAVDPNRPGLVYLTGTTEIGGFPLTDNPFQLQPTPVLPIASGTTIDGFVTLIDVNVTPAHPKMTLVASTYFGGSRGDYLTDIALDEAGNVYVAGETNSLNFPVVNPLRSTWIEGTNRNDNGNERPAHDLVVARFDSQLASLEFSTYFGGRGEDTGATLAVDKTGTIHVAATSVGRTGRGIGGELFESTGDFPVLNATQPVFGGPNEGFGRSIDAVVFAIAQRGALAGRGARALERQPFSGIVADFVSPRPNASAGEFTARIEWGDGESTENATVIASVPKGQFRVLGTHEYGKAGAFPVNVSVTDNTTDAPLVRNINISRAAQNQNGGSMAIDPTNPKRLAGVMTDETSEGIAKAGGGAGGILVTTSKDGGLSWSPRLIGTGADGLPPALGEPDVTFDQFGNLHVAYVGAAGNNIVVATSTDGGATFPASNVRQVTVPGSTPSGPNAPTVRGPKLAASHGQLWVAFGESSIMAAGTLVNSSGILSFGSLHEIPGSNQGQFSDLVIGPKGEILVVWQADVDGFKGLLASTDIDGRHGPGGFSPSFVFLKSNSVTSNVVPAQPLSDIPLGPRLAAEPTESLHGGRIFLTYSDRVSQNDSALSVYLIYSDDRGFTWSEPTKVSDHTSTTMQFSPGVAVDPTTGNVAVTWYQSVNEFAGQFTAISADGGETFSEAVRVSEGLSDAVTNPVSGPGLTEFGKRKAYGPAPKPAFFGGRLYPIWSDNNKELLDGNSFAPQFDVVTKIVGVIAVSAQVIIFPRPIEAVKGQPFDQKVATFVHPGLLTANDFEATILWGDDALAPESPGLVSQPDGPGTGFVVTGSHTYADAGAYPVLVRVRNKTTGVQTHAVSAVSAQQGSQASPTIAVDPMDPRRVFAAWVDVAGLLPPGIPIATSDNGGATWTARTIADGSDSLPPGAIDADAVFDQFGNLFLTYLTPLPDHQVVVLLSTDGGASFVKLRTFSGVASQPSIAVWRREGGEDGSVWLTWEQGLDTIMAAGAPVNGRGFVESFVERSIAQLPDGLARGFGDIAVGPAGQVLVTYLKDVPDSTDAGPAQIIVQLDPDGLGPQPFGPEVLATGTSVGHRLAIPAQPTRGIGAEGNLAWDRSDGQHRGRVYLVYTDSVSVGDPNTKVALRHSDDSGVTWSTELLIHDDPGSAGSAFLPSVAVDRTSGNVAIAWYAASEPPLTSTRLVVTLSDDGGETRRVAYRVSAGDSDATNPSITDAGKTLQFGFYTGLAFVNGILQPISTDNSAELAGNPDPPHLDIANARVAVAEVLRAPLVVQTFGIVGIEGQGFTKRVATFTDPGGPLIGGYSARINWGDGTQPTLGTITKEPDGSFTVFGAYDYKKFGQYPISVTIKGQRTKGEGTATAVIEDAPLDITIASNLRVIRELEFTKVVGTFTDLNRHSVAADFLPTITWGDGGGGGSIVTLERLPGSGQNGAPNTFTITGKYKYLSEETFSIKVSIRDKAAEKTHDRQGNLISGDPPLVVEPGDFLDIEALEGLNTGDLELVTFKRANNVQVPLDTTVGEYIATINWGDGQVDADITPFVTSEKVTVVGRHTYTSVGEFYPSITLRDDSGGFFSVPLIALVEPDVTAQIHAPKPGLTYDQISEQFVGDLVITNVSATDISGPLFVVIHDLPPGVLLKSFTAVDGAGNPILKVKQSKLPAGASLPPITLRFSNPSRVDFNYRVQVFDGLRPTPIGGASVVFEPNLGQANAAADFIARGQGYAIGLSAGQASLALSGSATQAGAAALLELVGANLSPVGVALDPQPGLSNYFLGETAITDVPHFGRVRYSQVYAGIDIEYYGRDGLLEYDWIVHPGVDPDSIAVQFGGVDTVVMDSAGNLRLAVNGGGELVQRAPVAYQIVGGARVEVAAAFDVRSDGTIGFTVGDYDPLFALVIDPVLVYSTYLGGTRVESAQSVAVDAAGNTYVTGITGSSDFFTVNPFDPELNQPDTSPFWPSFDAFVTKFDASGVLVFSTYLGGGSTVAGVIHDTFAHSIAVDTAGHVWVAGSTQSLAFPTTTSAPDELQAAPNTGGGFLTELSSDGSSILYSSVFGPSLLDIVVDDAGEVYAATGIGSALKLDPATNAVRYITLLSDGSSQGFVAGGIAVDSLGQAYVTGATESSTFPTKNALFPELHNRHQLNYSDAFVVKLSSNGDVLFSTYLGGSLSDVATGIAVDGSGVIHVVGQTISDDLPVPGGLSTSLNGGDRDGFLIKLANDGSSVLYGTYLGGSGTDSVTGVGVDGQGRTYVSGSTDSTNLPTVRAHQPAFGGSQFMNDSPGDGFAASIAADGGSFVYLTYWGGISFDALWDVAVDTAGNATYVGRTNSPDLLTRDAAQSNNPSLAGAFIVRLLAGDDPAIALHNAPFTTAEGNQYNGVVAFFRTDGTETAEQFSAVIDWGDGLTSAGVIAGDFHDGFQVFGNHFYADVGAHDVFVTLRDAFGRTVTPRSTGADIPGANGRVRYRVAIDTAALAGTQGLLSFQFNPGAIPGSPDAEARITCLSLLGGVAGASTIDGDASQVSSSEFSLRPSAALNRLIENVTLGSRIEFDLELVGPGLLEPDLGDFADVFALQLLSADGLTPLLSADSSASILRVHLSSDGSTQAQASSAAVTVAASGLATVENAPVSLALVPVTVQEGLEFHGAVATFASGNPLESANEFTAQIDWGDGSPVDTAVISGSNGSFTVSGAHVYEDVGSYTLVVKVIEPDGLEVTSATGRSILAALTFKNNWRGPVVPPVIGDFNGDGILDVAVGPFFPVLPLNFDSGVGILLGQGDGSFQLAGFQLTSLKVIQLIAADFNNDGNLDVAAVVFNSGGPAAIELLLGNGDGMLQPPIRRTELTNPSANFFIANIVAADFDRDGNVDLIYTDSSSNTLKVALGRGDGTFETPVSTTIPGGFGTQLYVADMDGDDVPDIIRASLSANTTSLHFHRGVGNGSFAPPITFASGLTFTNSLAIHDFDGDGNRDVAAAVFTNLNIYSGNGDGTFDLPLQKAVGSSFAFVAADFNGDGQVDLATSGPVRVFINDGAGGFADGVRNDFVVDPTGMLTGDFDRDGHIDLATSANSVISVHPGFGDGTFASAVRYASGLPSNSLGLKGVTTADVNGDTHSDAVLLVDSSGLIVTELGNGDGTFQSIVSGNVGGGLAPSPVLADVNNDGRLDVLTPRGGISIALGQGDGSFPTSPVNTFTFGAGAVSLADFNQDGRLDIAAIDASGGRGVVVRLANADGTLQNAVFYGTGVTGNGGWSIAVGDFNADSRLDLAVANNGSLNGSFTVSVLLGNADGTFATALNTAVGNVGHPQLGILPRAARVGDFNADGKLDLVVVGDPGFVTDGYLMLPGNGDGSFGAPRTFATTDGGLIDVAVGDFNADRNLDIVTVEPFSGGGLHVLLGNGDFTFQVAVKYVVGFDPIAVTLADFNHDGRLDIAAANRNGNSVKGGTVSILLGNADGTFQPAINYLTTGKNPRSITAGDLNADGHLDLAVVNGSFDAAILLGNGNGTFQPPLNYFTPTTSYAVAIGDLNGDGRADLVAGISLLIGNGDGTFPNYRLFNYLPPVIDTTFQSNFPQELAAGDLNADGNVDVAVTMIDATAIMFGNGNGSFLPPIYLTPPVAAGLSNTSIRVAMLDMDGDGDLDVVTLHVKSQGGGAVAMWRNNGAGVFSTPLVRNVPFPKDDAVFFDTRPDLEFGDLDGDGFVDVVVTDPGTNNTDVTSSGGVSVLLGIGDGSLAQPVRYLVGPRQTAGQVRLADVNRDGRPEIITMTSPLGFSSGYAVAVFTNNGDGSFGPARIYDHGGSGLGFLATGDFNSDGAADILVPDGTNFGIIFAGEGPLLVTDAPVTVTAIHLNPKIGVAFTATVATFTDDNPFGVASDFIATINWGDGQTSTGSVRDNPLGGFEVTGSHTYAASGVFTTTVTVRETGEGTHVGSAIARVNATDQALIATGLDFNAMAEIPFTAVVATFTDANPNGSIGDFSAMIHWGDGQTSAGAIAALGGGGFTVIGAHTYANPGALPVRVDIADIGGSSATANSTAQVAPRVNQAPVAIGDRYTTNEDTILVVLATQGVLANDTDLDGDTLSAVVVIGPMHGALTLNPNGALSYLPAANFSGTDSFTYIAHDGSVDSQVSTVTIIVQPVNDGPRANDDSAATDEDTPVVIHILNNDTGVDGAIDPANVVFTSQPIHGAVLADAVTGALTYTPAANFFGSDSLRYKVRDNHGQLSNEAVVSITVHAVNDAPVAANEHYVTSEDTPLFIAAASGLLANDTDVDGDSLTASILTFPAHGTLTPNSDGSFSYVPAADFSGIDSFRYQALDAVTASGPKTVTLFVRSVKDGPVVAPLADRTIDESSPFSGFGSFSDADPDDSWTATVDYGDGTGVQPLVLIGANFALDHNYLDSGQYFANVKVVDQSGQIGLANFQVTVQNLAATVQAGLDLVACEGGVFNILATFADPGLLDTHTATVNWGDGTATQSAKVTESGGFGTVFASHAYADENLYVVTVTVTDDEGASGANTLTATVDNVAPRVDAGLDRTINAGEMVALPVLFTTDLFDDGFGMRTLQAVAGSFVDSGALDSHTASIDWGDGTVESVPLEERTFSPQGSPARALGAVIAAHRYVSSGNFSVLITVTDNDGDTGSDSFLVAVNPGPNNNPPTANDDQAATNEDSAVIIAVLSNDIDADGNPLTVSAVTQGAHGIVTINGDGTVTYTPDANFHGPDRFTYQANDGLSDSNTTTVIVTVNPALVIEEILVNDGAGSQRSNIESLSVRFNQDANLQALIDSGQIVNAVRLFGSSELTLHVSRFRYDAANRTLRVDLTTDAWGGGRVTMLADNRYQLRLDTRLIVAAGRSDSHLLDRDGVDDFFGSHHFHRLLGDFDGDADVDLSDRDLLFQRYGALANSPLFNFAFDLTNDGRIDQSDHVIWKRQYRKRL